VPLSFDALGGMQREPSVDAGFQATETVGVGTAAGGDASPLTDRDASIYKQLGDRSVPSHSVDAAAPPERRGHLTSVVPLAAAEPVESGPILTTTAAPTEPKTEDVPALGVPWPVGPAELVSPSPDELGRMEADAHVPSSKGDGGNTGAVAAAEPDEAAALRISTEAVEEDVDRHFLPGDQDSRSVVKLLSDAAGGGRLVTAPGLQIASPTTDSRSAGRPRIWQLERRPPTLSPSFRLAEPYHRWNRLLIEHCLLTPTLIGGRAYLTITPTILSAALEAEEGQLLSPDDAAANFTAAVANAYQTQILSEAEKLWALAGVDGEGMPISCAFLALSVLAAYDMRTDEEASANAYYRRLAALLGVDLIGQHPEGFDPVDFEALWQVFSSWLESSHDRHLFLPGPETGVRRYVALLLANVPLRRLDIEKLPDFFEWAGLEPGSNVDGEALAEAFQRWASSSGLVSQTGLQAIADERRSAVESQLIKELTSWDGSATDPFGLRTAAVHLLLDFPRGQPSFSYLPRRPASFPATFDDGSHIFQSRELGWYEPVSIHAEEGHLLETGFRWVSSSPRGEISLHRAPSTAIALVPSSDFTGYLSQTGLPLGIGSAVLCIEQLEEAASQFFSRVTGEHCRPIDSPAVPDGWRLFPGIVPRKIVAPPQGLDAIAIEPGARVIFRGGLRVGRGARWLSGAPPSILVGGNGDLQATLDGQPAKMTDGVLEASDCLGVGNHVVSVGGTRRQLRIVEANGDWSHCIPLVPVANNSNYRHAVALPRGSWTVIGIRPDEVAKGAQTDNGTLLATTFRPVWAVSVGAGRGASVLCLADHPPAPVVGQFGRVRPRASASPWTWASTIYEAHIRRPRIGWLYLANPDVDLQAAWRSYWPAARALKRSWKELA